MVCTYKGKEQDKGKQDREDKKADECRSCIRAQLADAYGVQRKKDYNGKQVINALGNHAGVQGFPQFFFEFFIVFQVA